MPKKGKNQLFFLVFISRVVPEIVENSRMLEKVINFPVLFT